MSVRPDVRPVPSTASALQGVDAKTARAKHHLAELKTSVEQALDPASHRFICRPEGRKGTYVYRLEGAPIVDPEWSVIVGDVLFSLRSALDHLAWQLVLLDRKQPDHRTKFPILEQPLLDEFGNRLPVQLQPNVDSSAILEAIERAQPYSRMDGAAIDATQMPLWAINRLHNIDKHRLLLVVVCALKIDGVWWGLNEGEPSPELSVNRGPLTEGAPVAWFDFGGPRMPRGFDPHLELVLSLREPELPRYWHSDLLQVLDTLRWCVEEWIVDRTFHPLFAGRQSVHSTFKSWIRT